MKMYSMKEILKSKLQKDKKLRIAIIMAENESIFGQYASFCNYEFIDKNNKLVISIDSSTVLHYMYINKNNFLSKIYKIDEQISDLIFRLR